MPAKPWLLVLALLTLALPARAESFAKDGVAFVTKHCVGCHGEKVKRADLSLHTFRGDKAVLEKRKLWQQVIEVVKSGEMPPRPKAKPTQAEIDAFVAAVQGVFDHADRTARPDPGRVVVRRLNRTEYGNTIRDLIGVDFNPTEDFPSDDVGHGFDNIGDVLTLSPVLMERYLAAAESILGRAILSEVPKPPRRHVSARYLEPAQDRDVKSRPVPQGRGGRLHSPFSLNLDGEYRLAVKVYAESPDAEPARVSLKIDNNEVKAFDVKATKDQPGVVEATVTLTRGNRRCAVHVVNPKTADGKERTVHVEWLALTGPSDMRPETHRRLLGVTPGKSEVEQTREALNRFAERAYRRPLAKDELDRLAALAAKARQRGDTWEASVSLAMQAVLVSPKFLFRVELDDRPTEPAPHPIDEFQLASRLSYFLWSTMPDAELFALAREKKLLASLDAQVRRMLRDPKASALVENFALQWLQLRRLDAHAPDPKLFLGFTDSLRKAMRTETTLFFAEMIREDRSILDVIDGRYTYLNRELAKHYGIVDTHGTREGQKPAKGGGQRIPLTSFVRVELPEGGDRGGVLTHASVLTVTSNPTRTSPVKRGKWVLEQILGTPPPPPPPDVPELNDHEELKGSLRQRMEQHRKNPSCASCHAKMDPLGFAFENFDGVGRFRAKDGGFAIDPAGVLPDGRRFAGPGELRVILKEKKDLVTRCLTEKLLTYALGRGVEYTDKPAVDAITGQLAKNDYRFSVLVTEITKSFPFRMRRGKDLTP